MRERNAEPFFIEVITTTLNPDEPPIRMDRINYHNPVSREWLGKHSYWALRQGYAVHTAPTPREALAAA